MDTVGVMKRYWAAYFPTDDTFARIDSRKNTEKIRRLGSKEIQVAFDGVWFTGEIVEGFDSAVACDKFLNEPVPDLLGGPPTPRKRKSLANQSEVEESSIIISPILDKLIDKCTSQVGHPCPFDNPALDHKAKRNLDRESFLTKDKQSAMGQRIENQPHILHEHEADNCSKIISELVPVPSTSSGKRAYRPWKALIQRSEESSSSTEENIHVTSPEANKDQEGNEDEPVPSTSSGKRGYRPWKESQDEPPPSTLSGKRGRAPCKDDRLVKIRLQEVATASEEHISGTSSDMEESDDSSIQEDTESVTYINPPPRTRQPGFSDTYRKPKDRIGLSKAKCFAMLETSIKTSKSFKLIQGF
ncbi:uncharacterized protein LOC131885588 isoform X3 [Tigriopus californicus]|uniref:uncharacterized protein LOC131885588 isoform X3 n=1 Tax=Tigriopus californicus TaxID=6832 RepID=UPI0027DA625B|nr:uncharacterized protein LOC131885588 isoform X3 [Tigriopus californicus]